MSEDRKVPEPSEPRLAHQRRNEVLRTQGRPPETPSPGYRFGEAVCLTPRCGAVVHYEISTARPWHLSNDHVRCDRCAATYEVIVEGTDTDPARVTFRNADDRQS